MGQATEDELTAALQDADADAVAALVGGLDDGALQGLLEDDALRGLAVAEVFRRFPDYLDAERTQDVRVVLGFEVDAQPWTVRIADGGCTSEPGLDPAARVTLTLGAADFLRIVTGGGDPAALFLTGDLRVGGDEAYALEVAGFFRTPGAGPRREVDPFAFDVPTIAAVIGRVGDRELRERLRGGLRDVVLAEIFRRTPDFVRADKAAGASGVARFVLTGRADGEADRYVIALDHGSVTAGRADELAGGGEPRVTIRLDAADFLKLVTGNLNPVTSFLRGRVKLKGDVAFAANLLRVFHIPSPG